MSIVLLSAGHYPAAPGACFEGYCEHEEATQWVSEIAFRYGEGIKVVPTGVLQKKVSYINEQVEQHNAVFVLEVHFNYATKNVNGTPEPVGRGCETLYYPGSEPGKRAAEIIQGRMAELFPPSRGVKEGYYRMNPANGPDFLLARTKCPAVIVEPEFMHHKDKIQAQRMEGCIALAQALKTIRGELDA